MLKVVPFVQTIINKSKNVIILCKYRSSDGEQSSVGCFQIFIDKVANFTENRRSLLLTATCHHPELLEEQRRRLITVGRILYVNLWANFKEEGDDNMDGVIHIVNWPGHHSGTAKISVPKELQKRLELSL